MLLLNMGKCIGIISLKGGVGKTSIVSALGAVLSEFGKKVLVVDGNFSAPNLGHHLDVIHPSHTIHHVLKGTINPKDSIYKLEYFDLIPASMFYRSEINPLKLKDKLRHLKRSYDIIILDSSPALNDETLAVMNASDMLLVVTTPDHPTLSMTMKASKFSKKKGMPISGLILNKVHKKGFELSLKDIEKTIGIPVMAVVPHDIEVLKSLAKLVPYPIHKPKSEGSEEFRNLAASIIGEKYKPLKLKRFFRWINPRKQDVNRLVFYESAFQ